MIPSNIIKRLIKAIYLCVIFNNKHVLGFAGGNHSHKELFRYYGMSNDRIFLMPMMIDNAKFYQDFKKEPDVFTFLYVGRLVEQKGVKELIEEFNKHFFDKDVLLKIVGSGDYEDYLKANYHSSKIIFLGKLFGLDLIKEFHNASCFVFPTKKEAWGLVINEALSSGLPVIVTTHVGANFDLIEGKRTGFISENMNQFGEHMLKLYQDKELLMDFSKNARLIMQNQWNYNLYSNCLSSVVNKLELCE